MNKKMVCRMLLCTLIAVWSGSWAVADTCIAPDNGTGTILFPPSCPYDNPEDDMRIIDGLPPGTTMILEGPLTNIHDQVNTPGGSLGGELCLFDLTFPVHLIGTGDLAGYERTFQLDGLGECHTGPRNPGDPVQTFGTDMFQLQFSLLGDPDFSTLIISAGTNFGLPGPGQTTLTKLPAGDFNVDSFFDITYQIDFVGAPGSPLDGLSGTTTGTIRLSAGEPAQLDPQVHAGTDCWISPRAEIAFEAGNGIGEIPAHFFGPGSDPFDGVIHFKGKPLSPESAVDTQIQRLEDIVLFDPAATVDIQLVEMQLESTEPIRVTFDGGAAESFFDVFLSFQDSAAANGQMTVVQENEYGGNFTFELLANLGFSFNNVNGAPGIHMIKPARFLATESYSWLTNWEKKFSPCELNDFYPSGNDTLRVDFVDHNTLEYFGHQEIMPPQPLVTNFMIDGQEDLEAALSRDSIRPMTTDEWSQYMTQWANPNPDEFEGDPYPSDTDFRPAKLYVWEGEGGPEYPEDEGLVMTWGEGTETEGEDYASAWVYDYGEDPNLSQSVITVTVTPPSVSTINAVSFSLIDVNGLMRQWWWQVPGVILYNVATTVTIDASQTGLAATTPQATGYNSAAGFDITQVMSMAADENGTFFPSTQVPPPGQAVTNLWNYWYNLSVAPKVPPVNLTSKFYLKWSQPPVMYEDTDSIYGWDEVSVYSHKPMLADDWECRDERPVTDIHWWGSFLGWTAAEPPSILPRAFHVGIWTDVPAGIDLPYSHPGQMVWEHICDNYVWNFAGYDKMPDDPSCDYPENEACFQFNQLLAQDEWFYQEPMEDGTPRVYWLSLAAIYDETPVHPWGWKTRPKFYNDDAVRITEVDTPWPPVLYSNWADGVEVVECITGDSWDLAFELTTNEPGPDDVASADLNYDGFVDVEDFSIFASQFLTNGKP